MSGLHLVKVIMFINNRGTHICKSNTMLMPAANNKTKIDTMRTTIQPLSYRSMCNWM